MSTNIHPSAIIEDGAEIGENVSIGAFCVISKGARIGDGCTLHNNVTLMGQCTLGPRCEVFPYAVLGAPPQILNFNSPDYPLEIGRDCIIREHVTMHGGSPDDRGLTSVGDECLVMIGSHIAHDCDVGNKCVFANGTALAGHIKVGEQVWIGGLSAVHQFCRLGDHAFVGGGAIVVADVIPYGSVIGNHAKLAGLNTIGLKRRGFSRSTIHDLRAAYRLLFADEGTFNERIKDTGETYGHIAEVQQILNFITTDAQRPLCMPK